MMAELLTNGIGYPNKTYRHLDLRETGTGYAHECRLHGPLNWNCQDKNWLTTKVNKSPNNKYSCKRKSAIYCRVFLRVFFYIQAVHAPAKQNLTCDAKESWRHTTNLWQQSRRGRKHKDTKKYQIAWETRMVQSNIPKQINVKNGLFVPVQHLSLQLSHSLLTTGFALATALRIFALPHGHDKLKGQIYDQIERDQVPQSSI